MNGRNVLVINLRERGRFETHTVCGAVVGRDVSFKKLYRYPTLRPSSDLHARQINFAECPGSELLMKLDRHNPALVVHQLARTWF